MGRRLLVVFCFACVGQGRRVTISRKQPDSITGHAMYRLSPSEALTFLLLKIHLAAAFNPLCPRARLLVEPNMHRWTNRGLHGIRCSQDGGADDAAAPSPPPDAVVDSQKASPASSPGVEKGVEKRTFSNDWSGAGKYADEDPLPLSFWLLGPNPRRAIIPTIVIWGIIAPLVNLWGSGSFLCSLNPEAAREQRLDTFYPVSTRPGYPYDQGFPKLDYAPGFKRYVDDPERRFEFRYPALYVQDTTIYLRNQDRAYRERMMDPQNVMGGQQPRSSNGPIVAFGPPDQSGEENLSVVTGQVQPNFTLRGTLGAPARAAERLIQTSIAKPGFREVQLLDAVERLSSKSGRPLYQFEYRVEYPGLEGKQPTYTICVVGVAKNTLFTFASRIPSAAWEKRADALREAASSFVLS